MNKTQSSLGSTAVLLSALSACAPMPPPPLVVPSRIYADYVRQQESQRAPADARPRLRLVSDELPPEPTLLDSIPQAADGRISNLGGQDLPGVEVHESQQRDTRAYQGPLSLGDPGASASLWKEGRSANDLFRDDRAWQPMDLVTVLITETSEGNNEANTEVKQNSTILASIENLLGFEQDVVEANTPPVAAGVTPTSKIDLTSLIKADTQNDFKGEGKTKRKDSLRGTLSAMVVEVLPSGILRIEGQKIISVNSEERTMVLSGLVRPRDVNSENQIESSKIANMRIDYFGRGIVGEAQEGGWLSRIIRRVWPF